MVTIDDIFKDLKKNAEKGYISVLNTGMGMVVEIVAITIEDGKWMAIDKEQNRHEIDKLVNIFT